MWPVIAERVSRFVTFPHLWISVSLCAVLVARCLQVKEWPRERQLIELLAYGAGLYGGASLFELATDHAVGETGWALCAGGAVVILAAARGAYGVVYGIQPGAASAEVQDGLQADADPG